MFLYSDICQMLVKITDVTRSVTSVREPTEPASVEIAG